MEYKRGDFKNLLSITDRIGGKIDAIILPAVEGLNDLGFTTMYSCQGHSVTSQVESNEKYPFVVVDLDIDNWHKKRERLRHLINFYNKQVTGESKVSLGINDRMKMADVKFGFYKKGKLSSPERRLAAQVDSVSFGLFCRSMRLGFKSAINMRDILMTLDARDLGVTKKNLNRSRNSSLDFKSDYFRLTRLLNDKNVSFEMINEGMGL